MSQTQLPPVESLCDTINQMEVPSRIRAIELILHSLGSSDTATVKRQRGRLSELEGIGEGTWTDVDVDQFIREERDSWDS